MVDIARAFEGIDLGDITFVQYPGSVDDPAFPGKVVPDRATADRLIGAVRADRPFSLDAGATGRGATEEAPAAGTDAPAPAPAPSEHTATAPRAASSPSATPREMSGVTGQTAAQKTCAVAAGG
jgi:hypothetical protein